MRQQRATTGQLYEAIRNEFMKYSEMKENGIQKFTNEWILMKVGEKYFRSPRTVENIVFHRTKDTAPRFKQTQLFP